MIWKRTVYTQPSARLMPNIWDGMALIIVVALLLAFAWAGSKMSQPFQLGQQVTISLGIDKLPSYALQTVIRMFVALVCSFIFTLVVATAAAKSKRAGKIIIPLLDILQSVPILGYLSITITGFIALFPNSMWGPACAAIFAVFVSQVWNMTLSFYQSLITIPQELIEATQVYQLSSWQRFWRLEFPFAIPGLLWNAMMSMSGGWFFIVAAEAISVGNQTISLPGIGSYIAMAIEHKNLMAIGYAIMTMLIVILLYDQLFFRPLIAWSQKFQMTDIPDETAHSWVLDLLQRTRLLQAFGDMMDRCANWAINHRWLVRPHKLKTLHHDEQHSTLGSALWYTILTCIGIAAAITIYQFVFADINLKQAWYVVILGAFTAIRVFVLIILCSIIWVPIGVWIGLRPRAAQVIQPLAQFVAAFPANLFFPIAFVIITYYHLNFEFWCAPLMILGTQWYILFNVIAGASSIPKEIKLAAQNMQLRGWLKWKKFLLPAIYPFFVTGAITAAGGAWNASIVAEVINWGHEKLIAKGLGSYITLNTIAGHFHQIALGVVVMCLWVITINLLFWRPLYHYAETRYRMS